MSHRKQYGERLGKALDRISAPELIASGAPGIRLSWPVQEGRHTHVTGEWDFGVGYYPVLVGDEWQLSVNPVRGSDSKPLLTANPAPPPASWAPTTAPMTTSVCLPAFEKLLSSTLPTSGASGRKTISILKAPSEDRPPAWQGPKPVTGQVRLPGMAIQAAAPQRFSRPCTQVPPPSRTYLPVPDPEAVERMVHPSVVIAPIGGMQAPEPQMEFALAAPRVRADGRLRNSAAPEPAPQSGIPCIKLSAISFAGDDGLPRISNLAPKITPPEMSGTTDAPGPQPVESLPSFVPFEPAFTAGPATAAAPVWIPQAADHIFSVAALSDDSIVAVAMAPPAQWLPASSYGPYGISMAPRIPGTVALGSGDVAASASALSLDTSGIRSTIPNPQAFLPDRPGVAPIAPEVWLPGVREIPARSFAAVRPEVAEAMPSAPAMPVWSMPTFALLPAPDAVALEVPEMRISGIRDIPVATFAAGRPEFAGAMPSAPAMPVWSMPAFELLPCPNALESAPADLRLPVLAPAAGQIAAAARPELCGSEPSLPAMPVLSMPSFEFVLEPIAAAVEPALIRLPAFSAALRPVFGEELSPSRPVASPTVAVPQEAGLSFVPCAIEAAPALAIPLAGPGQPGFRPAAPLAPPQEAPGPVPVESMPNIPAFAPRMILAMPSAVLPQTPVATVVNIGAAGFGRPYPNAATPEAKELTTDAAVLEMISGLKVHGMELPSAHREPVIPEPSFIPIEFYCQRGLVMPQRQLVWKTRTVPAFPPDFALKIAIDRSEDLTPWKPAPKPPPRPKAPVPDQAKRRAQANRWAPVLKIAACLLLGVVGWMAIRELRLNVPGGLNGVDTGTERASAAPGTGGPTGTGLAPASPLVTPADQPKGAMATVKRVIANRAAVSLGDNLQAGMASWGVDNGWAPGWSRNPDGYVHPGGLAIFQPSQNFKDYRLEFFGQIEDKSMGWAVRAHDKQNFYAMKFTVVEPGLRPIIAMAHYPVVGGVKGHKVEAPLSVMVHNNTPFHVAVDVQGNRVTASIEGQEVDSWTDDLLPAGGVGFFAEAGEKARLYWMKVSKNQDWLGGICSYLSGTGSRETAEVWGPGIPTNAPQPNTPSRPEEFVVAEADSSFDDFSSPVWARTLNNGRIRPWNS